MKVPVYFVNIGLLAQVGEERVASRSFYQDFFHDRELNSEFFFHAHGDGASLSCFLVKSVRRKSNNLQAMVRVLFVKRNHLLIMFVCVAALRSHVHDER